MRSRQNYLMENNEDIEILKELRSYLLNSAVCFFGCDLRQAEDIVQDVLTSLLKDGRLRNDIKYIKAYSDKVLITKNAEYRRAAGKVVRMDDDKFINDESLSYTMDGEPEWADIIDFKTLLRQMEKGEAELMKMKYEHNMTNVAIARQLNMSEGGVRKRLKNAHENAKKIILKTIKDNEK